MTNQKMPDYETIRAAVAGEKWAVAKVVECYQEEINRQATVRKRQPDGTIKEVIEKEEVKLLIPGYYIMTLELGMRFLTDYLDGDQYFALNNYQKRTRPKINLERARNQLKLVEEIEKHYDELENIIKETLNELGYEI